MRNSKTDNIKMQWCEEVESALLKENVALLVRESDNGKIEPHQMKMMATKMGGPVHGVFVAMRGENISYTLRCMLDKWYNEELYDPGVDGVAKLIQILQEVGLKALAHKMKQHPTEKQEESAGIENREEHMGDKQGNVECSGDSVDEGKSSFQKLEERVGKHNVKTILEEVAVGNFTREEVEDFTAHLHPKVRGAFIRARGEVNFVFNEITMKTILSNWYEREVFKLTKEEAINKLAAALEKSEKADVAYELK